MKQSPENINIVSNLSPHLFWDVGKSCIDFEKNKKFIVQRVLEYGMWSDWQIIYLHYGIDEIAKTAITLKNISKKSQAFISLLSKIPKENFLCYTTMQSIPHHWNF